jgi:hypothetical protein
MQTESLWRRSKWQTLYIIYVFRQFCGLRNVVGATGTESIIRLENLRRHIFGHDCLDESYILVIGHSSAVVYFCAEIIEHFVGYSLILVQ